MSAYKSYPKEKDTPSRLTRKQARKSVYIYNRKAKKLFRKNRAEARYEN